MQPPELQHLLQDTLKAAGIKINSISVNRIDASTLKIEMKLDSQKQDEPSAA